MDYLALAMRWALAGVFIVSGIAKIGAIRDTTEMLRNLLTRLRLPATPLATAASWTLIVLEVLTGAALLVGGFASAPGFVAASIMLGGFTVLAATSARAQLNINCACFGRATARLGVRHVWRNLALLCVSVAGLATTRNTPISTLEVGGIAVAATAAIAVTLLTAFYDDIAELAMELRP